MLRIAFENPLAYRNANESYRLKAQQQEGFGVWPLAKVLHSTWVQWFHEESFNVYDRWGIQHYLIVTPEDIVEVLSAVEPKVEWLGVEDSEDAA